MRQFRVWRGDETGGELEDYKVEVNEGEVVLDVIHRLQATAGARPGLPLELQGRQVRLLLDGDQRQAAAGLHDPDVDLRGGRDRHGHAAADVPGDPGPGHRRLVQLREGPGDAGVRAAGRTWPRASTGCSRSTWSARRSSASASSASCARTPATWSATTRRTSRRSPARGYFIRAAELDMHPLDARTDRKEFAQAEQGLGFCNITKCCTEVCPEHIKITDNAIIPMKERVVDRRYDPLVWLGRKIFRRDQMPQTSVTSAPRQRLGDAGLRPRRGALARGRLPRPAGRGAGAAGRQLAPARCPTRPPRRSTPRQAAADRAHLRPGRRAVAVRRRRDLPAAAGAPQLRPPGAGRASTDHADTTDGGRGDSRGPRPASAPRRSRPRPSSPSIGQRRVGEQVQAAGQEGAEGGDDGGVGGEPGDACPARRR